jgi:hypothetical protein
VAIAFGVLEMVAFAFLMPSLPAFPMPTPDMSPEQMNTAMLEWMRAFFALIQQNLVVVGIVYYVIAIIFNAIGIGLLGYAYKSIKGGMEGEPVEAFA